MRLMSAPTVKTMIFFEWNWLVVRWLVVRWLVLAVGAVTISLCSITLGAQSLLVHPKEHNFMIIIT